MKACDNPVCDDPTRPDQPPHDGCNWLDGDTVCPHCGGPLRWFRGAPAGDLMDEMSLEPTPSDAPDDAQ